MDPKTGAVAQNSAQASVNQMLQSRLQPICTREDNGNAAHTESKINEQTAASAPSITTQILFAKQLEAIMLLSFPEIVKGTVKQLVCKASKYVVTAISTLPAASIVYLAKQGQLGKPCLDKFVDIVCKNTNDSVAVAGKKAGTAMYAEDLRRFHGTLLVIMILC